MTDTIMDELERLDAIWDSSWKRRAKQAEQELDEVRRELDVAKKEIQILRKDMQALYEQLQSLRNDAIGNEIAKKRIPDNWERQYDIYERSRWARQWKDGAIRYEAADYLDKTATEQIMKEFQKWGNPAK